MILAEYIWIDAGGQLRSKTRVVASLEDIGMWNYDGSSTGQASGHYSEVFIKPCKIVPDPFRMLSYLVLCDTWLDQDVPHPTNTRVMAKMVFDQAPELEPRFGLEQEFFLFDDNNVYNRKPQGNYYCGVGYGNAVGRECVEEAFANGLKAGLNLTGLNAEVAPNQWEYQIDAYGIDAADQLYLMRYITARTAEKHKFYVELHPKPLVTGDWNGSGCHCNFSTKATRNLETGYSEIIKAIEKLREKHDEHIAVYGTDNQFRLTGKHETASYKNFSYGIANRGASIRIPKSVELMGGGYFEDRRPAANMDPYLVCSKIFQTTSLDDNIEIEYFD